MSETILVTGGCGFIGSNFVHRWRREHPADRVIVLDKLTYAADPGQLQGLEEVELVRGDIQNRELVVHLLERAGVRKLVLEAARQVWAGDPGCRFLHVSTDEVYGALGATGKFSETMAYAPNSPYSATKAGSDHLVRSYFHTFGLPTVTTNCSNNYGPRQHREKLIPLAITRMAGNQPIPVYGDGQQVRDWLFVEDHCAAVETTVTLGVPGETYCIGGDNEWKNLDLLNLLCDLVDEALGRPQGTSRALQTFVTDRAGHDRRYAIDAAKIQRELGWAPRVDFRSGLEKTVSWYLQDAPK
jgi:dTDP-glucose 4,6-dehydratase